MASCCLVSISTSPSPFLFKVFQAFKIGFTVSNFRRLSFISLLLNALKSFVLKSVSIFVNVMFFLEFFVWPLGWITPSLQTQTYFLGTAVYSEDQKQCDEVERSKNVLAKADVHPRGGYVVKSCEDVQKTSRVPATTRKYIRNSALFYTWITHNSLVGLTLRGQCRL